MKNSRTFLTAQAEISAKFFSIQELVWKDENFIKSHVFCLQDIDHPQNEQRRSLNQSDLENSNQQLLHQQPLNG
jgi:hypothetical protein